MEAWLTCAEHTGINSKPGPRTHVSYSQQSWIQSWFFFFPQPCAFYVPCSVLSRESSNFISVPKSGRFQLIPGITSLLSPSFQCCPHLPRNFFSVLHHLLLFGIKSCFVSQTGPWTESWWRACYLPSWEGRSQWKDFCSIEQCVCWRAWPGRSAVQIPAVGGSSPERILKECTVRPGLGRGTLAQPDSWTRSTMSRWFLEPELGWGWESLPASVLRFPRCQ